MQTNRYKLHKNRDGYWAARYSERLDDGTYRSRTFSTRSTDRVQAEAFAESYFRGAEVAAASMQAPTVGEIIDAYLSDVRIRGGDLDAQTRNLVQVRRALSAHTLVTLSNEAIAGYIQGRQLDVANGTVRRELGALASALNWAGKMRFRGLTKGDIPFIQRPPEGTARTVFLSEPEEKEFWALAMKDSEGRPTLTRLTRFVAIALETAARTDAIETLTWDRVDFAREVIDFRDPSRRTSRKRRSVVPISKRLLPILKQAHAEKVDGFVIGKGSIRSAWETWLPPQFAHVNKHDLRRTWATLRAIWGVSLYEIAGVLGDDIGTVIKHYAVYQPGHLRGAVDTRGRE